MKSESWIIAELGLALLIFGILSFFRIPSYEKAAWFVIGSFSTAFSVVIGYKFGRSMPQQASDPKIGQISKSEVTTSSEELPPVI